MKKTYDTPEMDIIYLESTDIICNSLDENELPDLTPDD